MVDACHVVPLATVVEKALREELAILRARVAQLEAQAQDAERERLITRCSLDSLAYLVKYAAKPNANKVSMLEGRGLRLYSCGGRGGRGGRGGGGVCRMSFPNRADRHIYSQAVSVQLELSNDDSESSWC